MKIEYERNILKRLVKIHKKDPISRAILTEEEFLEDERLLADIPHYRKDGWLIVYKDVRMELESGRERDKRYEQYG